jgi:hypothetical protein
MNLKYYRFLSFACNAFAVLVVDTKSVNKLIFFYNTPSDEEIQEKILNKSYTLTFSRSSVTIGNMGEKLISALFKPFVMTFKPNDQCIFEENKKTLQLQYKVHPNGTMTYIDPKKPDNPTTYQVVFIDDNVIRYTLFRESGELLCRQVDLLK